jgi:hypothetical protein
VKLKRPWNLKEGKGSFKRLGYRQQLKKLPQKLLPFISYMIMKKTMSRIPGYRVLPEGKVIAT